jgi:hypothetical protein
MSKHLVAAIDGPFLCNGSRDGIWTLDPAHATCVECLRAALAATVPALRARLARALSSLASMRAWHALYHGDRDPCALCVDADGCLDREGVNWRAAPAPSPLAATGPFDASARKEERSVAAAAEAIHELAVQLAPKEAP